MKTGQNALRSVATDDQSRNVGSRDVTTDDVEVARDVLITEAAALSALSDSLGVTFCRAIDHLLAATGRVVVTGIGKSGHVARKIAATLASTGTPALFVHPAEASHGDLGMIIAGDAVIALSNSGEAAELAVIVAHASRIGLPLVAITSAPSSTLALAATVSLILPAAPEAGPIGLAPTTSTTMQMALGDAIAITLLARRGFSARDFRDIHPGGTLGARLKRVRELMHAGAELPVVPAGTRMDQALIVMTEKSFGCLGIVDAGGHLLGIVTDGDLRRHIGPDFHLNQSVDSIMTHTPRTIAPEALAEEALRQMNAPARPVIALFVVDDTNMILGLVHIHDLLRAGLS